MLSTKRTFRLMLSFMDFSMLFRLMQTRRDYRWDISTKGKGYEPELYWVHKELRKRMKEILLFHGGIRSSVDRLNFWIYRTKLHKLKE